MLCVSRSLAPPKPQPVSQSGARTVSLFNENLKFGAMPTHPLGASTVFHAGVIGQGVRKPPDDDLPPKDVVDKNTLIFVSSIFKMCHSFSGMLAKLFWILKVWIMDRLERPLDRQLRLS